VSVLDPPLEQRLRDSRLYKDPLAFVPLASVLALPVAYIYAIGYELGYAGRFGIPRSMVRVDLRSSLIPFLWLLFMIYFIIPFLYQVQQLGGLATLRVIAKRLRALFFLLEVIVGISFILQRQFTLQLGLATIATLYVILYIIPRLLGWLYRKVAHSTQRRRFLSRNLRRLFSAVWRHIFGEPWARKSLRFQLAYGTLALILLLGILPYGIGNVVALIDQKYPVLGPITSQGDAQAIVGIYADKVFVADVHRGVAKTVIVRNLDDVKDTEIGEGVFPGLALGLCRREPDQTSYVLCLIAG
jgi:hypothetical protein